MNTKTDNKNTSAKRRYAIRKMTVTGILAGVSTVLMMLSFSVPFMPSFIKLDISELPALLAAFAFGPVEGVMVCLIKNLINSFFSSTGCIGELSNFILGCSFVIPAGLLYKYGKNRKFAIIGSTAGAVSMAVLSLPINYYVMYPAYMAVMGFELEAIVEAYQMIYSGVNGLFACLLVFNVPFTFLKGTVDVVLTFIIYKRLSSLLHGKRS